MVRRYGGATVIASGPVADFKTSPAGLIDRLYETLRPEFCRDVLVFPASDPVFGGGACLVGGCARSARSFELCSGHYQRWKDEDRPPVESFCVTTDPRWRRQQPNASCSVTDCGYGVCRNGLCSGHFQRWDRSGRPDLEAWVIDAPAVRPPAPGARCSIAHCELWPHGASALCRSHEATWRARGRPDIEVFAHSFEPRTATAAETIELHSLSAQLKLEIQYALQSRRDDRAGKMAPAVVRRTVGFLATTTTSSLLDRSEGQWRTHARHTCPKDPAVGRLVAYAHRKLSDLADAEGWEGEFPR
ncbi:MAG: tyrosine-type recombinase/integrase, partial [Solirubrobacteraceae bacterium]